MEKFIGQIENSLQIEHDQKVFLGGTLNILNQPEFKDIEKVRTLLELLEEERLMKEMLIPKEEKGINVRIGKENQLEGMKDCSCFDSATFRFVRKVIGTLGVLGPYPYGILQSYQHFGFFD
jgi:heat-inducible transcriptional repressor